MLAQIRSRAARKSVASAALLAAGAWAGLTSDPASATTVATFDWVSTSSSGGVVTPTGSLTLSLPDSITSTTFTTPGSMTAAQMFASIASFSYTFGNGLSVGLASLNSPNAVTLPTLFTSTAWVSSAPTNTSGLTGIYLLSGFTLKGSKVFPGDSRAANFQLAEPAGSQNGPGGPSSIGLDSNNLTPFVGPATVDAGYWRMSSFVPAVPVPAALPLLLSGVLGLGGVIARRSRA